MNDTKNIRLTDDPLRNIYRMIPLLDDRAREAVSCLMYGFYIGERSAGGKKNREALHKRNAKRKESGGRHS